MTYYTGTRLNSNSDNPIGDCTVYDGNGNIIAPCIIGKTEMYGYSGSGGRFDWGVSDNLPRSLGLRKNAGNLLARTILEIECKQIPDLETVVTFRRFLFDKLDFQHWEVTEEDVESALLETLKVIEKDDNLPVQSYWRDEK